MGWRITGSVVVGLLMLAAVALWLLKRWMDQALYTPGSVRASRELALPLDPPSAAVHADGFIEMGAGVRLFSFTDGQGRRVVVLHGGPGIPPCRPWRGLRALADRFAFSYYHQRGCGRSARPFEILPAGNTYKRMQLLHQTLGLPAQLADIERLRRAWGETRLTLIGHSFGALLAALYAAEFPGHVKALVLVAPAPLIVMPPAGGDLLNEIRRELPEAERARYQEFLGRYLDFRSIVDSDERTVAALNREFGAFYAQVARQHGMAMADIGATLDDIGGFVVPALYLSLGRRHDWSGFVREVQAPVLVLHGERDLQSEQASQSCAAYFRHARFQVIRGAGHFPFEDQPEAFASAVAEFLEGT
jgi:proline iminopeptidase